MSKGISEKYDTAPPGVHITARGFTTEVNCQKQEAHSPQQALQTGKSVVALSLEQVQRLINECADKGAWLPPNKEIVDFKTIIGTYVSETGVRTPTTIGIIHFSKTGTHLVPARAHGKYKEHQ